MAEMAAAGRAMYFRALHTEGAVLRGSDRPCERLVEARPSGAAIEFGIRFKQGLTAAGAAEHAGTMFAIERTRAGAFGAMGAQYPVLLGRQLALPFRVGLFDSVGRCA